MLTPALQNCRFLKAARCEPTDTTPIWIMRQAGRYLPEYMSVRRKVTFIELCKSPELAADVTLSAQRVLGVDAAILFADLLPMLEPMGIDLEYAKGEGPVIHNPIQSANDVDRIRELEDVSSLHFVFDAVKLIRQDLPADIPLLGFAGAPFTLASYAIEGGGSKNYVSTKTLMYTDEGAWRTLMERLSRSLIRYINAQIEAGCQAVQLFDSWAGCLSPDDYRRYVLPFTKQVIDGIHGASLGKPEADTALPNKGVRPLATGDGSDTKHNGEGVRPPYWAKPADPTVPVINFLTGNPALLPLLREAGGHVIGLDWRVNLADGWKTVGYDVGVQGNLDPVSLMADLPTLKRRAKSVLDQAAGRPGHIFNLGHGVFPEVPPDNVIALVQMVHEMGQHA